LGGVYTALSVTEADWNLVVACDMPGVTTEFLEDLLNAAEARGADCLVPGAAGNLNPLCAVYHRRCLPSAVFALDHNILKMHDFLSSLHVSLCPLSNPALVRNVNTPEQWRQI
jgi:molybdopterin-guanine dinucleotide biosynthesis protein A